MSSLSVRLTTFPFLNSSIESMIMFVAMYLFMKLMGIWGVMVAPFVLLVLNNFRQKNNFQEIYKIIKKSL